MNEDDIDKIKIGDLLIKTSDRTVYEVTDMEEDGLTARYIRPIALWGKQYAKLSSENLRWDEFQLLTYKEHNR